MRKVVAQTVDISGLMSSTIIGGGAVTDLLPSDR